MCALTALTATMSFMATVLTTSFLRTATVSAPTAAGVAVTSTTAATHAALIAVHVSARLPTSTATINTAFTGPTEVLQEQRLRLGQPWRPSGLGLRAYGSFQKLGIPI